jgi:tetratricopeptide (TPR) repeat protein
MAHPTMGYYWAYYALTLFAAYAVHNPLVCGIALVVYFARPWLPDPVVIFRNLGRVGALKRQVTLNASNVTARRDLGWAYLELRRPRTALRYLDEARERDPRDPDIAYLRGSALLGAGRDDEALRSFGLAVGIDPDKGEPFSSRRQGNSRFSRYSETYLGAATALERLGRWAEAEQALAMASDHNSSLLEPLVRMARVRRRLGDGKGAAEAAKQARRTFGELPGFMRRRQIGWGIRAYLG